MSARKPPALQGNVEPEKGADLRKYEVGRLLTFKGYSHDEAALVPCRTFRRGQVLRVLPENGCTMGIDVVRVKDGVSDMVWHEEVSVRRDRRRRAGT